VRTAISIPDELFRVAEAAAVEQFLKQHDERSITERLNELYSRLPAKVDPLLERAQLRSLKRPLVKRCVAFSGERSGEPASLSRAARNLDTGGP
jgi:hypothetical protein